MDSGAEDRVGRRPAWMNLATACSKKICKTDDLASALECWNIQFQYESDGADSRRLVAMGPESIDMASEAQTYINLVFSKATTCL